jgi:transcriptional regulator with GAF, ATPase, and Fis domain
LGSLIERLRPGERVAIARPDDLPPALIMSFDIADRRACALCVESLRTRHDWPAPALATLRFLGEILASAVHRRRQELEFGALLADLARRNPTAENGYVRERIQNSHGFHGITGDSPPFAAALDRLRQVAPTDASVLLHGETGTGKELFARALHDASARRHHALVRVNCAALPATLIESELFGHERGAFTGAVAARQGRFELAHLGTIFLDEIGDLPLELQPRLLRVLQEGEFERVGSSRTRHVDVRVICATHRDLEAAIVEGQFREDLYYRIGVYPIALPPLRKRKSDIPLLVWFFIHKHARALGRFIDQVATSTMHALESYDWPGNVRELENLVERAVIRSTDRTLVLDQHLDGEGDSAPDPPAYEAMTLADVERKHVGEILRTCSWRINGPGNAADRLRLHPNTLRFRMKKLGIVRPSRPGP